MAGAGFKTFNTGDVLTASDVNTYLMQQTVMVFASAAARTTALGANVAEGMLSYLKDTDAVEVYNGSAWVSSDDPNAIQNTIVDAKGDIITATAADTPARLAVGTDGHYLVADSTAATGLNWSNVKRQSFTPTWGVVSGTAPSLGNGSLTGNYVRVGDMVYFQLKLVIGSTTTLGSGAYTFSLPIAAGSSVYGISGIAEVLDAGVSWYRGYFPFMSEDGYLDKFTMVNAAGSGVSNSTPITFGTNDQILVWGVYAI